MCTRCSQRYGMALEHISNQQAMEILEAKAAVENKKRTYEKVQRGPSTVKSEGEVVCKAQKEGRKVHWSHLHNTK